MITHWRIFVIATLVALGLGVFAANIEGEPERTLLTVPEDVVLAHM